MNSRLSITGGAFVESGFWNRKRVLVTGHTGFKGAWLSLMLHRLGARVCGYSLAPPTDPSLYQLAQIDQLVDSVRGDIRDYEHFRKVVRERRPEIVLHLAAQSLVRRSYRDPVETYHTNVLGTVHVLEAVRLVGGVRVVINVTSDKCYENRELLRPFNESDRFGGHDPYSSSKGCAELVANAYRESFFRASPSGPALASVRAGNVIGGGDWAADRLIPDCLRSLSHGRAIEIRNPAAVRPWQLVVEPLAAYLQLAERLWDSPAEYAEGWNFGPEADDAWPVEQVVNRLVKLWGPGARWTAAGGEHPHEARYLALDCAKARERLGWRPRTRLETALEWIVDWHRRVASGESARTVSLEQIDRFWTLEKGSSWASRPAAFAKAG